jgi:rubrerythrin
MLMIAGIESSDTALTTVSHAAAGKIHKQFGAAARRQTGSFLQTNLIVICPECGMRVLPKTDGTCPSCQAKIPA